MDVDERPLPFCRRADPGRSTPVTGFVRHARDGATNRDTAAVGMALGWIGLEVLLLRLAPEFPLPPEAYFYTGPWALRP